MKHCSHHHALLTPELPHPRKLADYPEIDLGGGRVIAPACLWLDGTGRYWEVLSLPFAVACAAGRDLVCGAAAAVFPWRCRVAGEVEILVVESDDAAAMYAWLREGFDPAVVRVLTAL